MLYLAAAEASPDAINDGEVVGAVVGVIEECEGGTSARWTELRDRNGRILPLKAEGIAIVNGSPGRLLVAVDVDAHDEPSELLEVQIGNWQPERLAIQDTTDA